MRRLALLLACGLLLLPAASCGPPPAPPRPEIISAAENLAAQGSQWYRRGCLTKARALFAEALAAARLSDDVAAMARARNNLAATALASGDLAGASRHLDRAEQLNRTVGSPALTALILGHRGTLAYRQGDIARANILWRRGVEFAAQDPATGNLAALWTNLAMIQRKGGDLKKAAAILALAQKAGGEKRPGYWLQRGLLAQAMGNAEAARGHLRRALALDKAAANPAGIAEDLSLLGELELSAGRRDQGLDFLDRAARLWAELGRPAKVAGVIKAMTGAGAREAESYNQLLIDARQGPSPLLCR